MTTTEHTIWCIGHAEQCLSENLCDDGREAEDIECATAWGIPRADVISQWLADGTVTCMCDLI